MKSSFIASLFVLLIAVVSTSAALAPESVKRAAGAAADAEKWTNARRMSHGLLPRRPTRLYSSTNVGPSLHFPFPSFTDTSASTPPTTFRWPRVRVTLEHVLSSHSRAGIKHTLLSRESLQVRQLLVTLRRTFRTLSRRSTSD